jgi:hypothetical protein
MYCSGCGANVNSNLTYCNSCGERLVKADDDKDSSPGKMLENVVTALCVSVVFGFGILVGLVAVLLGNGVPPSLVTIIAVVYLVAVFGIAFTLVRQIQKLIDAKLKLTAQSANFQETPRLSPMTTGGLEEFREPVKSVTDRTTNILDKVPVARK